MSGFTARLSHDLKSVSATLEIRFEEERRNSPKIYLALYRIDDFPDDECKKSIEGTS